MISKIFNDKVLLVWEPYTQQYIHTTHERIWFAMYKANEALQRDTEVSINLIISILGGTETEAGSKWKWYTGFDQTEDWMQQGYTWIAPAPNITRLCGDGVTEAIVLYFNPEPCLEESIEM